MQVLKGLLWWHHSSSIARTYQYAKQIVQVWSKGGAKARQKHCQRNEGVSSHHHIAVIL